MSETTLRLDRWLWHARFVRRREMAAALVEEGCVRLNGELVTRPHRPVRAGDVLTLGIGTRVYLVRVVALGRRRGPAAEARTLYEALPGSDPLPR